MSILESMKTGSSSFSSIREYDDLLVRLNEAERKCLIVKVPVVLHREINQIETWFQDKATGIIYSLRPPEFPAKGYWGPIPLSEYQEKISTLI